MDLSICSQHITEHREKEAIVELTLAQQHVVQRLKPASKSPIMQRKSWPVQTPPHPSVGGTASTGGGVRLKDKLKYAIIDKSTQKGQWKGQWLKKRNIG